MPFSSEYPSMQRFARGTAGLGMLWCILWGWCAELNMPQVKARYIHHFMKYSTWPETNSPVTSFVVAIMETDTVKEALCEVVRNKKWMGKPFEVLSALASS